MARTKTAAPLRTGGHLWGPRRVELGISIRKLAEASGIARGMISLMENGRLNPTGREFDRVMAALEGAATKEAGDLSAPASPT